MSNIDQLDRTMTFIVDHPEKHDQRSWVCETGACLAGHAVLLNGYRAISQCDGLVVEAGSPAECEVEALLAFHQFTTTGWWANQDLLLSAGARKVRDVAIEILDLIEADAEVLFGGANTIDKLQLMVKDLSNGDVLEDLWLAINEDVWGNPYMVRRATPVGTSD